MLSYTICPLLQNKNGGALSPLPLLSDLCFRERVLAQAADGAHPILGNVFPGGAGSDTGIGIAHFGIVNITAGALVLHGHLPFFFLLPRRTRGFALMIL